MTANLITAALVVLAAAALDIRNHRRNRHIMSVLDDHKTALAALHDVVATIPPLLAASATLTTKVIATLEDMAARLATVTTDPAALLALTGDVNAMLMELRGDANAIAVQNVSLQAELDKVTAPPPAPAAVTPAEAAK